MTKGLPIAMFVTVMAFVMHLQLQIDSIKGSPSRNVQMFNDGSREPGQTAVRAGGGPFIDANYGSEAPVQERVEVKQTQHEGRSKESGQAYTNAYINPDWPPTASDNSEARNIGEQLSVDDISAYENFDARVRSIGEFIDADSTYR